MNFEVLVEDQSGKAALDILLRKIIDTEKHSFRVIAYKGVGHIPKNMKNARETRSRALLDNLSKLLQGYGNTYKGQAFHQNAVIVVLDLDERCQKEFRRDLMNILKACNHPPKTQFCFAVEEGEAWLLGDMNACRKAFPKAKWKVLQSYKYKNDSICGTWELLADAIYPGGRAKLKEEGWAKTGEEKSRWASTIAPFIDVDKNASPSFQYFRDKLLGFVKQGSSFSK